MRNLSLYIDIAFCVIVLPVMVLIFPVERWLHYFQWYVISVGLWLYATYFINRFITVPYLFKGKHKMLVSYVLIAISVIIAYMFSQVNLYNPKPSIFDAGINRIFPSVQQYQQAVWSLFMIVETFSFAVSLLRQANIQRSKRRAVEAQRDKAEIELYKAQIKPHFMFNTLNSLYGLFLTKNDKALESLEKFISMMRYIHTTANCDLVPLTDEVDYIKQYVGLQSLRLNEMTEVELNINIADKTLMVPPMLLVTFVENCFKHGTSPIEKSKIIISLEENNNKIVFRTSNSIFPVKRIGEHMGIENCKKRLEMLYPDRHGISIENNGTKYKVELQINLQA